MEILLLFASAHDAIRAETILLEEKLAVKVMPLPPAIAAGCGICLRICPDRLHYAMELLSAKRVPLSGVCSRSHSHADEVYTRLEVNEPERS